MLRSIQQLKKVKGNAQKIQYGALPFEGLRPGGEQTKQTLNQSKNEKQNIYCSSNKVDRKFQRIDHYENAKV